MIAVDRESLRRQLGVRTTGRFDGGGRQPPCWGSVRRLHDLHEPILGVKSSKFCEILDGVP